MISLLSDSTGFAKIYEVYEQNTPKILKVLKEHLNNQPKAVELFRQEAAVLEQLNHPGIPKGNGYFQYQTINGKLFHCLVMEKIDGVNLDQWLTQQGNHPISQKQAIAWLKQLGEILHLVHSQQWFHRDIKSSNVMLRSNGQLVLIDFGTAREATYSYLAKMGVGYQVTAVVSFGYTPLEQKNGHAVPQSDFFALGRTFVHLLTGTPPGNNFWNAHDKVLSNWRTYTSGISPLLLDFIDNLMAQEPGKRPLNTQVLLQRLEEIEQKLQQNKKIPLALVISAAMLALGGFGYWVYQHSHLDSAIPSDNSPTREELLTKNTAQDLIESWLSIQTAALGPNHETMNLEKILVGSALSQWRQIAEQDKVNNRYQKFFNQDLTVESVQTNNIDQNQAQVEATLKEATEFYENSQKKKSDNQTARVKYNLVRVDGVWRIQNMSVLQNNR
ncbi:MAG: IMS domain-containing protein [Rhizonema sp. PD38]|nr:IMS domain-containing protein [Rhizonema sp. PD38]